MNPLETYQIIQERNAALDMVRKVETLNAELTEKLDEAESVCFEAYQVIGCLLDQVGLFESDQGQKILDNLSQARMVHQDTLPWPVVEAPEGGMRIPTVAPIQP